jgi:hypothetical protein
MIVTFPRHHAAVDCRQTATASPTFATCTFVHQGSSAPVRSNDCCLAFICIGADVITSLLSAPAQRRCRRWETKMPPKLAHMSAAARIATQPLCSLPLTRTGTGAPMMSTHLDQPATHLDTRRIWSQVAVTLGLPCTVRFLSQAVLAATPVVALCADRELSRGSPKDESLAILLHEPAPLRQSRMQ